jgi:ribosomal protein S18 acetylase RimI-like enzyme
VADVIYRRPKPGDLDSVLANIRQADRDECEALFGAGSLKDAAVRTVANSLDTWVAEVDGEPVALFGVVGGLTGRTGYPWMFGTDAIDRNRRSLMRDCRGYIQQMLDVFPRLTNLVDARNEKYIRWLKRIGFRILSPINIGVAGLPFYPFEMGA